TFDDAAEAAADDAERTGATQVPPFGHPLIMAGQGTVALEAAEQLRTEHGREMGTMVLPVGGGGLLGGCGAWLRERSPATRIVGVEPAGAVSMAAAVRAGRPVTLHDLDRFVDGAAVRRVGAGPLRMVQAIEPDLISVEEGAVCTEMLALYQVEGIIAEPAGALTATAGANGAIEHHGPGGARGRRSRGGDRRRGGRGLRRQQRRLALQRDRGALPRPRGPQALLPGHLPAGAGRAAPLPRPGAGAGRRHRAVRLHQAQQP